VQGLLGTSTVSTLYEANVNTPGSTAKRVQCGRPQPTASMARPA
jgi:hypothetical protein